VISRSDCICFGVQASIIKHTPIRYCHMLNVSDVSCRLASAVVCGLMEVVEPPILSDAAIAQRKESSGSITVARRPMHEDWTTCQHLKDAFGLALTVLERSSDSGSQNAGAALSLAEACFAWCRLTTQ
jgi:hypothetical protein